MNRLLSALAYCLALTPFAASAVTLDPDQSYTFADVLAPGDVLTYSFTVSEALNIANFVVTATDTNGGGDIATTTFSYYVVMDEDFDSIVSSSGLLGDPLATGAATSFIAGWGPYASGDSFSFIFKEANTDAVSLGLSFQTTQLAPVPLPATGGLLILAIGAAAALSRHRDPAPA